MPGGLVREARTLGMTPMLAIRARQRVFAGSADQVRHARDFTRRVLDGCPVAGEVVLLVSEVTSNAVLHTASGQGGVFSVIIWRYDGRVEVEVRDGGSVTVPAMRPGTEPGESGYGLGLVDALASRWGHEGGAGGRVVWFELEWQ
jgi:anti-sigma regulatory factor (Ser/Thr protein kinase)